MSDRLNPLALEENARAVETWRRALHELEQFEAQNPDLLAQHKHLLEQVSAARDAIEKLARSQVISLGPVTHRQTVYRVDADKILKAMGAERFAQIGGTMETKPSLSIATLRAAEKRGEVSAEEVQAGITPIHTFTVLGKAST